MDEVFVTMLPSYMSFINSLMVIDYTLLYGETDPSNVTSRKMEEMFVTSCMSLIDSLMVIDDTLLYGETVESAVTSRNTDEVFVTMQACLSGIFSSLWKQSWKMVHLFDGKSVKDYNEYS